MEALEFKTAIIFDGKLIDIYYNIVGYSDESKNGIKPLSNQQIRFLKRVFNLKFAQNELFWKFPNRQAGPLVIIPKEILEKAIAEHRIIFYQPL